MTQEIVCGYDDSRLHRRSGPSSRPIIRVIVLYARLASGRGVRPIASRIDTNPAEQAAMAEIRNLRRQVHTLRGIAATLNGRGRRTRRGTEWRLESVARVIKRNSLRPHPKTRLNPLVAIPPGRTPFRSCPSLPEHRHHVVSRAAEDDDRPSVDPLAPSREPKHQRYRPAFKIINRSAEPASVALTLQWPYRNTGICTSSCELFWISALAR